MDDVIWGVLDKKFCSFKSSVGDQSKTEAFCRHKMNVTGICSKMTCPLANSRYATVREENGRCYLYMKTIERAHLPSKLWEKIRLSRNYRQALAKVDEEMQYFPKMLRHKAKQRLTKIHQYLLRMRKLRLADRPKMVRINRKRERRDKRREAKAEMAAKIEAGIKKSLLARAKTGMYKDILNFPQSDFDRALDDVGAKEDELDEGSDWDQVDEFEEGEEEDEEELEVEYADELDESDMEDFGEEWGGDGDDDDDDDDDDIDVPEEVEELLDILLTGLRDSDTIVRWSAAKGVGRLTGRLPRLLADDVVLSVLELLDDAEGEGAWHGGCLALAELARRGLLLPARLPQVVPVVRRALVYDVRKGSHSVGADVRDAACYVCWAFARAYAPAVMAPFVRTLSQGMLVTAVFDRQVNCRRAASAAFQENVGRQGHGNFPNGISILTAADYFTLGNRVKAYTEISVYIAQFPAYRTALLEHLLDAKLCHWDVALRQLAAQTLHNMAPLAPGWMVDVALPTLVPATLSTDLLLRHGATLAVAELLRALAKIPVQLPADLMKAVRNIVPRVEKARLYRGRGGHLMRAAVCRLIECLALAGHALSRRAVLRYWKSLDETMKHPDEEIKAAAVAALRALSRAHTSYVDDALVDRVVRSYVKTLRTDDNPGARRGFTLALGALAPQLLLESSDALASAVDVLTHCAIKDEDAETRRNALQALREMALALHVRRPSGRCLTAEQGCAIFDAMLAALNDYATDDRGDVGSWSRVAAMQGIAALAVDYCRLPPEGDSRPRRVSTPWGEADVVEERVEGALLVVDYQPPALGASYFPYQRATIHSELAKPLSSSTAEEFMLPALEERAAVALVDGASEAALASIRDTLPAAHFLERPFLPRPPILGAERTRAAVAGLMKQLAERADNVRGVAGRCLMAVLHSSDPTVRPVPELDRLRRMFKPSDDMNWTTAADTFPLIVRVLDLPAYQTEVALGLSISVGGLTESVVKAASAALTAWTKARVKKRNLRSLAQLVRAMLSFFDSHRGSKRIQVALLKTVKLLMDAGALTVLAEPSSDFLLPLLTAVKASVRGCKDTARLHASIGVFLAFLDYAEDVRNSALLALLALLGHRYPTLRKAVAHQLYLALLAREGELIEGEEAYEDVLDVLTETAWDGAADEARAKRDELYAQFGLEKPAVVERRPRPAAAAGADEDELESYAALVKEMGY
eukprot:PLAT12492.34.p1 GENE.PLAT12492.34~~PLAT12492.34.p1  ORF type:complete len:1213 (-),score=619.71 PLAT12492.34:687-4325(-)